MTNVQKHIYDAFSVYRIKDIYFSIKMEAMPRHNDERIRFELGHILGLNREGRFISLILEVRYRLEAEIIAEIKVQNVFSVPALDSYVEGEAFTPPSDMIVSMVSIGIAHTRALLAKNVASTPLENYLLPVFNPLSLSQEFFPGLFKEKEPIDKETVVKPRIRQQKEKK